MLFRKEPDGPDQIMRYMVRKHGWKNKQGRMSFRRADACQAFHLADFAYEVTRGVIAIDFDAREASLGSPGLRNHGTEFGIPPDAVCRLYMQKHRI